MARAAPGSVSSRSTSSSRGAVNGWCIASHRRSSSFHSNSGNSMTHRSHGPRRGIRPRRCASSSAKAPRATVAAERLWSATSSTRSPALGARPRQERLPVASEGRAAGRWMRPRPRAPRPAPWRPSSSRRSVEVVELLAGEARPPGTARAFTAPPCATACAKTLKTPPREQLGQSTELQLEAQVGLVRAVAPHRLVVRDPPERAGRARCPCARRKISATSPSTIGRKSSRSTNDISMSICVNSGWRSARRSSSRKQRTIWK